MVDDNKIAWHAGKSKWKNINNLNKNSIGIEIQNKGHLIRYQNFPKKQILPLVKLIKILMKKYKIKRRNILGHSDIAPNRKKDPGEKFPWKYLSEKNIGIWHTVTQKVATKKRYLKTTSQEDKIFYKNLLKIGYSLNVPKNPNLNKINYFKKIVKAFQRRFRQELIDGKVDQECLIISKNLTKKLS